METVRYFWHGFIHRGTTFMYLQYSRPPYHLLSLFGRRRTPSARPSLLFRMDRTHKFISCVVPGPPQWFFHSGKEIVIAWTREKTMTLGGAEPLHSSWQWKVSRRCCHGPLVPLIMGDPGTSDMSPCDYIFPKVKEPLRGNRYDTKDELLRALWQ